MHEFLKQRLSRILSRPKSVQIFLELPVQFKGLLRREMRAQHHVADMNGVRKHSIFCNVFERDLRVVMIHGAQTFLEL